MGSINIFTELRNFLSQDFFGLTIPVKNASQQQQTREVKLSSEDKKLLAAIHGRQTSFQKSPSNIRNGK